MVTSNDEADLAATLALGLEPNEMVVETEMAPVAEVKMHALVQRSA